MDSPTDANEAAAFKGLQALPFPLSVSEPVSVCPAHSLSQAPCATPVILPLHLRLNPPLLPPFLRHSPRSVTPRS